MNKNYDLTWDLKRLGTLSLVNRTISFNWSVSEQTRTYTLPAEYKDLDYVDVEITTTWTNDQTNRRYTGPMPATYSTQATFTAPSIAIQGGTNSTYLSFATKSSPNSYNAVNPWASGSLPLDSSLPWKSVSHSTSNNTMSGFIKAIINNPYKNNTKDTYLHGSMQVGAEIYWPSDSEYGSEIMPIFYNIDNNVLTIKASVPYHYSLSVKVKMTGHGKFDIA